MIELRERFRRGVKRASIGRLLDPRSCPDVARAAVFAAEIEHTVVQELLDGAGTLENALLALHQHQEFKGFIQGNSKQIERVRMYSRDQLTFLFAHYNAGRAKRYLGAGRAEPPDCIRLKNARGPFCFLCEQHQNWQQRGLQISYRRHLANLPYRFCCNPFPFGRYHTTVVSDAHVPQDWKNKDGLEHLLAAMLDLGVQLPGWIVLYNGAGAGATIPYHRHFHLLNIEPAQHPFPLQHAAARISRSAENGSVLPILGGKDYPLTAIRLTGASQVVLSRAVRLALEWHKLVPEGASENIAVVCEGASPCLYYVPRDSFSRGLGFSGAVAGLEVLGELVFSSDSDLQNLQSSGITYERLSEILNAVNPLRAQTLLAKLEEVGWR